MSDHFSLKHPNHFEDMFKEFEKMYTNQTMFDVIISCFGSDLVIRAHRVVLAAGSDFFRQAFTKLPSLIQQPVMIASDIEYSLMKTLVEFIYRGQIIIQNEEKFQELRIAAEKLKIKGFKHFVYKLTAENSIAEKRSQNIQQFANKRLRPEAADTNGDNVDKKYTLSSSSANYDFDAVYRAYAHLFNNMNNNITDRPDTSEEDDEEEDESNNGFNFELKKLHHNKSIDSGEDENGGGDDDDDVNVDNHDNRLGPGYDSNNNTSADNNLNMFALMAAQYGINNLYDPNFKNNMFDFTNGTSFNPFNVSSALVNFNENQKQQVAMGKHVCNICGKTYAWKSGLYKHKRQMHSIITKTGSETEAGSHGDGDNANNEASINFENTEPVNLSNLLPQEHQKTIEDMASLENAENNNTQIMATEQPSNC